MKVTAAPGIQVPKEDDPRSYITADEAVEVPDSAYYLRMLADGDLVVSAEVTPPAVDDTTKTGAKTTAKGAA